MTKRVENCDCSPPLADVPSFYADSGDQAVVNHALYVADHNEEIRWAICEAARRALDRLAEGEFGRCIDCGEMINPKRLMAVPWAECCVRCQAERENYQGLEKVA